MIFLKVKKKQDKEKQTADKWAGTDDLPHYIHFVLGLSFTPDAELLYAVGELPCH